MKREVVGNWGNEGVIENMGMWRIYETESLMRWIEFLWVKRFENQMLLTTNEKAIFSTPCVLSVLQR